MSVHAPIRVVVTVHGMRCHHCVMSVTEGLEAIDGVIGVEVRLETGAVTVLADRDVRRAELAAAVEEAGFAMTD
jgi:copper chaperone